MRQIPYSVAAGSGITPNGSISCAEIGGIVMLHIDMAGGKLANWTKVAEGLPPVLAGYSYIQIGTQDFAGYCPAKLRIIGGEMHVRASAGTWAADTVVIYPRG